MKLTVRTGGNEWTVDADSAMDACVKAFKTYGFDDVGLICTVTPEGKPDITEGGMESWLVSTERALQEAGIEYRMKDGREKMKPRDALQ